MTVPKLRFKEFSGTWQAKKIKEITSYVDYRGKTPEKSDTGIFLVTAKNIRLGYIDYESSKEYIPAETYEDVMRRGKPIIGDVLITTEAPLGNVASVDREDIALAQRVIKLRGIPDLLQNTYLKFCLLSEGFQKQILEKATGGTVKGIKGSVLHKINLTFPSLSEQTKIANFLTAIDEKITQLTQKCDLLAQYKKGVMQQIFSQKLRFKDDDDSELRTGKLKDFGYFYYGKSVPKSSISNDAKTPCVRYGELYSTYRECIKNVKSYTNISPDNLKFSKGGEVLIPRVGEDPMDFANCSYLPIANVAIGEMISVYNTKENGLFLAYYINSMLKKQLAKFVEGGSVSNLYFSYLEDIEIIIPSLEKQTKIANFLTAIDDKITQAQTQLEAVKRYKKGLLQQLFV